MKHEGVVYFLMALLIAVIAVAFIPDDDGGRVEVPGPPVEPVRLDPYPAPLPTETPTVTSTAPPVQVWPTPTEPPLPDWSWLPTPTPAPYPGP